MSHLSLSPELPLSLTIEKLPKCFNKETVDYLKQAGCTLLRQGKGDHEIWVCPLGKKPITVDSTIKSRHTANAILKAAGIGKKF